MSSLKHKTISGIKWTLAASIAQRIISFGTTVVLARILSPADFGLFALAFVMIDGFGIFKSLGFDSALVRRKDEDIEKACNTAFFLIPAMGMILFIILFFFAPIGAKFLNNPQVAPIIRTLALVFVISTFGKVPQTVLYRSMKFKYKSIAEVSGLIIYSAVALILAFSGFGVWSLVVAYILRNFTQILIEWHFSEWSPRFEFDKSIAWDMFHFGKYILGSGIITFLYSNLDNIIIGKLLGVTMLGYYAISMNITTFLSQYFLNKVGMVMYPVYSRIQKNAEEVRMALLKALRYVALLTFPFAFGVFLFARDILHYVFGDKWLPATNTLKILSFAILFRSIGVVIWPAFLARGRSKVDFQISLIQIVVFFLLVAPLTAKFKLTGAALAILISSLVSFVVGMGRLRFYFSITPLQVFRAVKIALYSSVIMFLSGIIMLHYILLQSLGLRFLVAAAASTTIYIFSVFFQDRNFKKDVREILSLSF